MPINNLLLASILATALSVHGYRKKSLSPGGALTAFLVGLLTMSGGIRAFGVSLMTFYFLGSRATKYGKNRKRMLEEGYVDAGYRSGWQVLCNSFSATLATTIWSATHVQDSIHNRFFLGQLYVKEYHPSQWCTVAPENAWSRALVFVALGQFGCCLGDTMASELGILSASTPRLITTGRKVPPGTNGGVSAFGTACSIAGGVIIGLVMGVCIAIENPACKRDIIAGMVGWGALAGGFGSLLDSLLGATLQRTRYSKDKRLILQDGSTAAGETISGWNLLTNNQVNLVSGAIVAILCGWLQL